MITLSQFPLKNCVQTSNTYTCSTFKNKTSKGGLEFDLLTSQDLTDWFEKLTKYLLKNILRELMITRNAQK